MGTDGFTSPPKESALRVFFALKIRRLRPGVNLWTWVPKASTLPLDHRSRFSDPHKTKACEIKLFFPFLTDLSQFPGNNTWHQKPIYSNNTIKIDSRLRSIDLRCIDLRSIDQTWINCYCILTWNQIVLFRPPMETNSSRQRSACQG